MQTTFAEINPRSAVTLTIEEVLRKEYAAWADKADPNNPNKLGKIARGNRAAERRALRWVLAALLTGETTERPSDAVEDALEAYSARHPGPGQWVYHRSTRAPLYPGEYSA